MRWFEYCFLLAVLQNRVSDNVGPCQVLLSALLHALKEERHFALVEGVAFSNRRLARNRFQAMNSVRPMHLFGRNRELLRTPL